MTELPPPPAITLADEAVGTLRTQIRSLLGLIDTARRPEPAGVIPPGKPNAGPVWKPLRKWVVRWISEDDCSDENVYITTPLDWGGDFTSLTLDDARALAMSLLAACEWAERGGPATRSKYPVLDDGEVAEGRTFICGGSR